MVDDFKNVLMCRYWLLAALTVCWLTGNSFTLPVKQKQMIEKLIVEGDFEKALSAIGELRDTRPDDTDLLILKGICYYKLEAYKVYAPPTLLNALALSKDPNTDIDITYHLAQAYIANADYANAVKNYKRLRQIVPEKFSNFHQKIDSQITFCQSRLTASPQDTLPPEDSLLLSSHPAPPLQEDTASDTVSTQYTIQICTMSFPLADSFFKGQYGVKLIQMGDLYRYIYNIYPSIEEARAALPTIRKIYPDAFIREFNEEKLGKAIDLNTDRIK